MKQILIIIGLTLVLITLAGVQSLVFWMLQQPSDWMFFGGFGLSAVTLVILWHAVVYLIGRMLKWK